MYIHDYRVAQALRDYRLERAQSIRDQRSSRSYRLRNRVGHWLIHSGVRLSGRDLEIA